MSKEFLEKNPDLIEIARKYSREQLRKYREEQRRKAAETAKEAASEKTRAH